MNLILGSIILIGATTKPIIKSKETKLFNCNTMLEVEKYHSAWSKAGFYYKDLTPILISSKNIQDVYDTEKYTTNYILVLEK